MLANRLSEDPSRTVLLIESGKRDTDSWIHIPATFFKVLEKGEAVHPYASEPEKGLNGRPSIVPQGNVLGGGSSINAMIYIRGHRNDYDTWAQSGCPGWSYEEVLPAFRSLENNETFNGAYHGQGGTLFVSNPRHRHPLSQAFVTAATETGIPANADFNGENQAGAGFYQSTTHNGRRWSSAQAFLREAEQRKNLTILTETPVQRIVIADKRAVAVELEDGTRYEARREIALTAGAIATPRILQLSGIGNGAELSALGIAVTSLAAPRAVLDGEGVPYASLTSGGIVVPHADAGNVALAFIERG